MQTTNQVNIPLPFIVGLRVTTNKESCDVFISKIYVNANHVSISITYKDSYGSFRTLGVFSGTVTQDYQSLPFYPNDLVSQGYLIIGEKLSLIDLQGSHFVDYANGKIEDSCVVCIKRPWVTGILNNTKKATGDITLVLDNISETLDDPVIGLDVVNSNLVASRNDVSTQLLNCRTNIISGINSVAPDSSGNIDIFGISPIVITVGAGGVIGISSTIDTADICPDAQVVVPPILFSNLDSYPDIMTVTEPEWKSWPAFTQ